MCVNPCVFLIVCPSVYISAYTCMRICTRACVHTRVYERVCTHAPVLVSMSVCLHVLLLHLYASRQPMLTTLSVNQLLVLSPSFHFSSPRVHISIMISLDLHNHHISCGEKSNPINQRPKKRGGKEVNCFFLVNYN